MSKLTSGCKKLPENCEFIKAGIVALENYFLAVLNKKREPRRQYQKPLSEEDLLRRLRDLKYVMELAPAATAATFFYRNYGTTQRELQICKVVMEAMTEEVKHLYV